MLHAHSIIEENNAWKKRYYNTDIVEIEASGFLSVLRHTDMPGSSGVEFLI